MQDSFVCHSAFQRRSDLLQGREGFINFLPDKVNETLQPKIMIIISD